MKCAFVLLVAFTFLSTPSVYAEGVHGVMMVVKGTVKIQSGKDNKITLAKVGAKVYPQDTISAEKDSRAKIVMSDKNEINISPETKLSLEKYIFNPQSNEKNVLINVVYGKVRSSVSQKYDGDKNQFHVKTPSAVAGVRGTDFLASFDQKTNVSKVVTFSGIVEVGSPGAGGSIANPVRVAPGQFTTAGPNAAPTAPAAVPKAELTSLNQETKADTAKGTDSDKGSLDNKADKKDKKDEGKKEEAKKDPDKGRVPASATSGSMLQVSDTGPAATGGTIVLPEVHALPPTPTAPPPIPKCDFCQRVITSGPTNLNIQINVK